MVFLYGHKKQLHDGKKDYFFSYSHFWPCGLLKKTKKTLKVYFDYVLCLIVFCGEIFLFLF